MTLISVDFSMLPRANRWLGLQTQNAQSVAWLANTKCTKCAWWQPGVSTVFAVNPFLKFYK